MWISPEPSEAGIGKDEATKERPVLSKRLRQWLPQACPRRRQLMDNFTYYHMNVARRQKKNAKSGYGEHVVKP